MVAGRIPGSYVLDLFAGSGAFGLEAVSRGAEKVFLVESSPVCISTIKQNVESLDTAFYCEVLRQDAADFVENYPTDSRRFDLIFADPPYGKGLAKNILLLINHYDILMHSGLLVIEHHRADSMPEAEGSITILKQKTYGDTTISVYTKND